MKKAEKLLTKNSRTSMIRIVQEDPVIGLAIHNLATSTLDSTLVPKKYCIQILCINLFTSVILPQKTTHFNSPSENFTIKSQIMAYNFN